MAITSDQVRAWLKLDPATDVDLIDEVTAATNELVGKLPVCAAADAADPPVPWPDDVMHGAVGYAARLYRNRNSPQGTDAVTGGVIYPPKRDADIERLLGIARPRVG
jgi:hypothetical protein